MVGGGDREVEVGVLGQLEDVAGVLAQLRGRGIVELGKGWVEVRRPAELAAIAELN